MIAFKPVPSSFPMKMGQDSSFALPIERLSPKNNEGRLLFGGGRICPCVDPEKRSPSQAPAGDAGQLRTWGPSRSVAS